MIERVIHRFGVAGDGAAPFGGLTNVGDVFYGTTAAGGTGTGTDCNNGCGTIFRITSDGTERVLYSFHNVPDGAAPRAGLVYVKDKFYGTAFFGGTYGDGAIFSVTKSGAEKVLHSFTGSPDGERPESGLVEIKGKLYGTTPGGGAYGNGTVFSVTQTGQEKVIYSFKGASYGDGAGPQAGLIDVAGDLYGTTLDGGSDDGGVVFKITTSGKERVLYRFAAYRHDGTNPVARLAELNGILYGTTIFAGKYQFGAIFSVTTSGVEKVLHSFKGSPDGAVPRAGLLDVSGTLYGTTWQGGSTTESLSGVGTVYSVTPSGKEHVVYSFGPSPDGAFPATDLIDVNGTLVGTTAGGGAYDNCEYDYGGLGCGTVFTLTPSRQR